jgi:hypothetical protein
MSHRNLANEAFSARAPTVRTDHVGGDGSFVDKYKASGVKQPLLADPASALARHVVSLSLCGAQAFVNGNAMTSEKSAERAAASRISPLVQRLDDLIEGNCSRSRLSARICSAYPPTAKYFRHAASVHRCHPRETVAST